MRFRSDASVPGTTLSYTGGAGASVPVAAGRRVVAAYSYREDPGVPTFPDDRPLMVFDGDCVVCSAGARFVLRHDRKARHRLAMTQSPLGRALYAHYGLDPDRTNLLLMNGRPYTGSEAVLVVAQNLGAPWSGLRLGRLVPRALREALYRRFARNRYRWFGRRSVCMVPPPDAAERFMS